MLFQYQNRLAGILVNTFRNTSAGQVVQKAVLTRQRNDQICFITGSEIQNSTDDIFVMGIIDAAGDFR